MSTEERSEGLQPDGQSWWCKCTYKCGKDGALVLSARSYRRHQQKDRDLLAYWQAMAVGSDEDGDATDGDEDSEVPDDIPAHPIDLMTDSGDTDEADDPVYRDYDGDYDEYQHKYDDDDGGGDFVGAGQPNRALDHDEDEQDAPGVGEDEDDQNYFGLFSGHDSDEQSPRPFSPDHLAPFTAARLACLFIVPGTSRGQSKPA
ncbi:hypothetical protein C8F01DRAFT_1083806 [Mycena amicta]|nr:hypothetical protein C8F01DRAFT_1083806 [Mycena amicta]